MPIEEFVRQAYKLKSLSRQGWVRAGVTDPESVAAHSWGIALLVIHLAPPDLDILKALAKQSSNKIDVCQLYEYLPVVWPTHYPL